jgi:GntR family carbon starvation induced transcriptional regulator
LDGRRQPRVRLRIDLLSKAYGASLGAVREALVRLTAEGLVAAEPPKGFMVAPISLSDLDDLTGTRIELEARCLRRSIQLGDIVWEGRVISALHQLVRTPLHSSPDALSVDWAKAHKTFHDALVSACDSFWRLRLREQLFVQAERYRRFTVPYRRGPRDVDAEHQAIAEAALARDADAAAEHMAAHLRLTADLLRASDAPFDDIVSRPGGPALQSEPLTAAARP